MKNFLFLLFVSVLIACNGEADNTAAAEAQMAAQKELSDAAMAVHDEVMPMMGEINRLKRQIEGLVESEAETLPEATQEQALSVAEDLKDANEAMMTWMSNIPMPDKLRNAGQTHEQIMTALSDSNTAATAMNEQIKRALENGRATLASLQRQVE